jgi:hypothetical protein
MLFSRFPLQGPLADAISIGERYLFLLEGNLLLRPCVGVRGHAAPAATSHRGLRQVALIGLQHNDLLLGLSFYLLETTTDGASNLNSEKKRERFSCRKIIKKLAGSS